MKKELYGKRIRSIKYENHKIVLSVLRQEGAKSIREIARTVKLSTTAVGKIISSLQEKDLVVWIGKGGSTNEGGKRPDLYALNGNHKFGIVITASKDTISGHLFDISLKLRAACTFPFVSGTYQQYIDACANVVFEIMRAHSLSASNICGIVNAFSGIVDVEHGVIVYPTWRSFWGKDLPFCRDFRERLGFPVNVFIDNDCRLSGYAELLANGKVIDGSAFVLGTAGDESSAEGAGGCIISHDKIRRGVHGYAGEIGHIVVNPSEEERCICGRYGCFQTQISEKKLLGMAREQLVWGTDSILKQRQLEGKLSIQDVLDASNQHDELAQRVVNFAVENFARVIENIILLIDPDRIIIQGAFSKAGEYFLSRLERKIQNSVFFGLKMNFKIVYSSLDNYDSVTRGAALYLFDSFFDLDQTYD